MLEQRGNDHLALHELALIYAVIALGTVVNMELPPLDPSGTRYLALAQKCLVAGRFLIINTMTCLQALASHCSLL